MIVDFAAAAGNFRILLLRKNATLVSVATLRYDLCLIAIGGNTCAPCSLYHLGPCLIQPIFLRVFGDKFAEMPFVATKEGYRREGNCKRLLKVCLALISEMLCTVSITLWALQ